MCNTLVIHFLRCIMWQFLFNNGSSMDQYITFFSNHPMLSMAWVALIVMIIIITIKIQISPIKMISPQELTFLVNREDGLVVDIRDAKDFKARRIVDSKHLAKEKITNNDFVSLENSKDKPIIVVCNAGMSAQSVASQLLKAGFSKVNVLKGGISAWSSAGLPVVNK